MNKDKYYEMIHMTSYIIKEGHEEAKRVLSLTDEELKENIRLINPIIEIMVISSLEQKYGKKTTDEFFNILKKETKEDVDRHIQDMILKGDAVAVKQKNK